MKLTPISDAPKTDNDNFPGHDHRPVRRGARDQGAQDFDEFRAKVIASLPQDLSQEEFKKQSFERIYGAPMEDFLSGAVTDAEFIR